MLPVAAHITVRNALLVCCVTLSLGAMGCGQTGPASPIATPAVGLNRTRVPLGGPLEMTYRFTVAEDAPELTDDYRVFVHFLDVDGQVMFSDDHQPATPASSWRPGQVINYSRRTIVPVYPYIGEVTVAIGLYSRVMGDRLPLAGDHLGQREYRVATMEMAPQSESGFLFFEDGWHEVESVPEQPEREWQWTTDRATISFRNPRADSTLYLEVEGRPELLDAPQILTLAIDDTVIQTLEMVPTKPNFHIISIPAASFGADDAVMLTLNVDQIFVPALVTEGENSDDRELGVQVFYAFLEQK
jgi:hypothetical protein